MSLELEKLTHTIFHRDRQTLHAVLSALNDDDLHNQSSPVYMREHAFKDSEDQTKERITFLNLLSLLHKYEFHDRAEELLNRFHHVLEYHELVGALRLQITNDQFEIFKRAYTGFGESKGVFTQLASDIVLFMPRSDAKYIFSSNKNKIIITKLTSLDDYYFLNQFNWFAPTQAILLQCYQQFSQEIILAFLKSNKSLLFDIVHHTIWINQNGLRINLFHRALISQHEKVVNFLLAHAHKLAVDIHASGNKMPYWQLSNCLAVFEAAIRHEKAEQRAQIKLEYCIALFTGVIGNIPLDVYAELDRDREKNNKQLWWVEDSYFSSIGNCVTILEEIISEDNELIIEKLTSLIRESALTLLILNAAIIYKSTRLVQLIATYYQKKPVELLRYLSAYNTPAITRCAFNQLKKQGDYQESLMNVCESLFLCKLDSALLILIKFHRQELFEDRRFSLLMRKYFNPKILLACLKWGYSVSEACILNTAAFAVFVGDVDSSAQLMVFTSYWENSMWLGFLAKAKTSQHNRLWDDTPEVVNYAYGSGFTQDHYKDYQLYQAQLVCFYFYLKKYSFNSLETKRWQASSLTFDFLGKMRNRAAMIARSLRAECFGKPRENGLVTPIAGQYERYLEKAHHNYRTNPSLFRDAKLQICESDIILHGTIYYDYNEFRQVPLTTYHNLNNEPAWRHTRVGCLEIILHDIHNRIVKLLSRVSDAVWENQLVSQVATIHWLLAHAAPLRRGSSSVTESICAGLMMYLDYSITYTHQVDCEALTTPDVTQFRNSYPGFFKAKPIAADNKIGTILVLSFTDERENKSNAISMGITEVK